MIDMNFEEELRKRTETAEKVVRDHLPVYPDYRGSMADAMIYSVEAGGKRLRPVMLEMMAEAYGGDPKEAGPFMAAIEFIHTSSLIHDDLPALDNDELRRGKPSVHARFGEAMGVLSGDALLNYAYEVMMKGIAEARDPKNAAAAAKILADKSGLFGMLGGQGLDVEYEKGRIAAADLELLKEIHIKKTSALIEASLMAGAALAGAGEQELELLEKTGRNTGLAFQIRDDILDATSSDETLGKPAHSDEKNGKQTYCTLLGIDEAQKLVNQYTEEAVLCCENLRCESGLLKELILYLCDRRS